MRSIYSKGKGTRARRALRFALPLAAAVALAAALFPISGSAQSQVVPKNAGAPTILGTSVLHKTLTATKGTWSGAPTAIAYRWLRCPADAAAAAIPSNCSVISGATASTYLVVAADVGLSLRARVIASNKDGTASAYSSATGVVTATVAPPPPFTGCPSGTGLIQIAQLSPPARLLIDHQEVSPNPVTRSTTSLSARFHVTACGGRSVQGALVYTTTVPFSQFSVPPEQATGVDGWVTLKMQRLAGFPVSRHQRSLVMFGRARKAGESELGGISTRRLVAFRVR